MKAPLLSTRHTTILALALLLGTILALMPAAKSYALSGSDFNPAHIIDDAVFTNKSTMSVSQIQTFLNNRMPSCDVNGTGVSPYWAPDYDGNGVVTKAEYGQYRGNPAPFTCLKDYRENTTTGASNYGGAPNPSGSKSAAQIIWDAAQAYDINPQVILVKLQKEQALITDDWPFRVQYDFAMGYGCFDNAGGCSETSEYPGFFEQVDAAAWQLRQYMENPQNYNFAPGTNFILYNPNTGCGGSNVNIVNLSTAALYNYTPYQPNQAALDNLYGTGNGCSAYGNRNFWRYFNDWFGSTLGPFYSIESVSTPPFVMTIGEVYETTVMLKNNSSSVWYSDGNTPSGVRPFRLMTDHYYQHQFADSSDSRWLGTKNQIRMLESSVAPGETATFSFNLKADSLSSSNYHSRFYLVQDGVKSYREPLIKFSNLTNWDYSYSLVSKSSVESLLPGDLKEIEIKLLNTGQKTWYADGSTLPSYPNPVRISTLGYVNSPFALPSIDSRWLGTKNQIRMLESSVAPGETATFKALIGGPAREMQFSHKWRLVIDGVKTGVGKIESVSVYTPRPDYSYKLVDAQNPPSVVTGNETFTAVLRIKNQGNNIWVNDSRIILNSDNSLFRGDLRMVTAGPTYRDSVFSDNSTSWFSSKNQVRMVESVVLPGEIGTFQIPMISPDLLTGQNYSERFKPVLNGFTSFKDKGFNFNIFVTD